MSAPHCDWCACPFRAVLLQVTRAGARPAVISRHYGLHLSTVSTVLQSARKLGCLPAPACTFCPRTVNVLGGICGASECRRAYERECKRLNRARYGRGSAPGAGRPRYIEPEGFVWPVLPENQRRQTGRVTPVVIRAPPILYPAFLRGEGNRYPMQAPRNPLTAPPLAPTLCSTWDARWRRAA
jgi:hypothetical protein